MKNFQAKPEHWELQEQWSNRAILGVDSSCFLELRSRVEALEAKTNHFGDINKMVPPPVATDEKLNETWLQGATLTQGNRAVYNFGIEHGQVRSQTVAKLAPPEPPTDEELHQLWLDEYAFHGDDGPTSSDVTEIARAVLKRWGNRATITQTHND